MVAIRVGDGQPFLVVILRIPPDGLQTIPRSQFNWCDRVFALCM